MTSLFPNTVFISFLLLGFLIQYLTAKDTYCNIKCGNEVSSGCDCSVSHDECQNPDANKDITPSQVDFRKLMMKAHNELRNDLALGKEKTAGMEKGVANMRAIDYDLGLELTARCWMNKCKPEHDKCRATPRFDSAGQNMFFGTAMQSSDDELKKAVKMWYKEIEHFTEESMNKTAQSFGSASDMVNFTQIGHFTQLAWGSTYAVGCARYFDESINWKFAMACNYGPAGNVQGASMYTFGKACSKCGDLECNKEYKGLCGEITYSDANRINSVPTSFVVILVFCSYYVPIMKYIF